jgi:hypothetical protein
LILSALADIVIPVVVDVGLPPALVLATSIVYVALFVVTPVTPPLCDAITFTN